MPMFKTLFNGYSIKCSPFYENQLAVATAQNFGILGNDRVHIFQLSPNGPISELTAFDTADGVYDVCWSEAHDSLVIATSGDGSVKLYDSSLPPTNNPICSFQEHTWEIHFVDYNTLWTVDRNVSVRNFKEHAYCVYSAAWNSRHADIFASASGDCTTRIWDVREPSSTVILPAHKFEILTCDWNKYDDCIIATTSIDKVPIAVLNRHGYAVRKVRFSPHKASAMTSCSYDMTVCMWDYTVEDALIERYDHHTEFAVGVDMSVLVEGLLASTGWDELVYVWQHGMDPRAP
ncbi:hypothetical protein R3W88_001679 [Solanum pinnatisectum]|uniref:Peroxin-7 n=1 Tax=Solanum pinnatisectum TaxID=50273 RepID=A0AAV9MMR3_9SOLN|nr:hypothetical protein R3W88_001679 [Solanum pinnatisectum]